MSHRWKRLRRVSVTNSGQSYETKPAVTVAEPAAPKQEAKGTAAIIGGTVNAVTLDSGGNFYKTQPAVTIAAPDVPGGTQAVGVAVISGGEVTGVNITNPGTGYSSPPTVTIDKSTDPKSDFAAAVTLDFDSATGTVTKVNISDSGNFYDSSNPPVVTIAPPFAPASFERGEDVKISSDANGAVVEGEVAQWIESSQTLSLIHTSNDQGTFIAPTTGLIITGTKSGASRRISKVILPEIAGDVSDEFNDETEDFLDFTETNPFGEPEVATIVKQKADSATAAAAPATEIKITGSSTDPAFTPNKTYKVIANDSSSQFVADEDDANFVEGVRDLNVTSLTIGTNADNNIEITYTPQDDSDTLVLAGDGFTHIGVPEGNYQLNTGNAAAPTVGALQPGDSAAPRVGDSVDAGFMSDTAFTGQVAGASTSMVWDSAAIDFGTGVGGLSFIRNFPITTADVPGLSDPSGVIFGKNGRRLYFTNKNYADSSAIVYGAKLETPYDISSISDGDEERADLSTVFARSFMLNTDSSQFYGGQRLSALAFNPQGTKMYAVEADRDILNQFNLSDSWDISTATYEKGLAGTAPYGYSAGNSNVTLNANAGLNNTFSMEWYDSGRKMAVGKLGVNGPVDELTFTTPYDISTFNTKTSHTNNIIDSYGTTNKFVQKLAFSKGSMFNKDGSRRYYIQRQFSDSDYDSSSSGIGNGLNGNRMTLLRTDLSTPYDLSTMAYHSQIELTNLPDSGAPTKMNINGAFAMRPDGSKIFVMTNSVPDMPTDSGWTGTNQFNIIEFGATADSAGSSFINLPDISVKPMIQADSATAWAESYLADSNLSAFRKMIPIGSAHYVNPIIDSDGSFFDEASIRLISTVDSGARYETPGIGNVFYLSIDEGFDLDSSKLADSNYTVTIDSDRLYGGGYGLVFGLDIKYDTLFLGNRGIFGGGVNHPYAQTSILYLDLTTPGNTSDFGDFSGGTHEKGYGGASNGSRGVMAYGKLANSQNERLDYITISTPGNSTLFGQLGTGNTMEQVLTSDGTYGLSWAGRNSSDDIQYFSIATIGDATNFGSQPHLNGTGYQRGGINGPVRNMAFGGEPHSSNVDWFNNLIHYVTVQTPADATQFGTLSHTSWQGNSVTDASRAVLHLGYKREGVSATGSDRTPTNTLEYLTMDTESNTTDFGDLSCGNRYSMGSASNGTRGVFAGGLNNLNESEIDQITIQTLGNSTDFGDMTSNKWGMSSLSGNPA